MWIFASHRSKFIQHHWLAWMAVFLFSIFYASTGWTKPTTADEAFQIVHNWLTIDNTPLGAGMGREIEDVFAYFDENQHPLYFIVNLKPAGFVIVSGEDLVEPIIGFSPWGDFDPQPSNPLGALVNDDMTERVTHARLKNAAAPVQGDLFMPHKAKMDAKEKWAWLKRPSAAAREWNAGRSEAFDANLTSISDIRVAPLVQSAWGQSEAGGSPCYNYFTPNYYPSGCVATAMAQLMRYHQHPALGVGINSFKILIDDSPAFRALLGGDRNGGPYDWFSMKLDPNFSNTDAQCQASGALTHDAGIAVNMNYTEYGSGADTRQSADALMNVFHYANAVKGWNDKKNIPSESLNKMVNPNLDAYRPVLLGIRGRGQGHAIIVDGYGYNAKTIYHHLNLGWRGSSDAWYNLPTIDTRSTTYTSVYKCVYNIFPSESGEIISGRIVDLNNHPIDHAMVTAHCDDGFVYHDYSDSQGVYALTGVPSASSCEISTNQAGFTFHRHMVETGVSTDGSVRVGNVWGVDFIPAEMSLNEVLDNKDLLFKTNGHENWFGQKSTARFGASAAQSGDIEDSQYSVLETTMTGPGILSFFWRVSSEKNFDFLECYIDGALRYKMSGSIDWVKQSIQLGAGSHSIKWQYAKDPTVDGGQDCGWVDNVSFNSWSAAAGRLIPVLQLLLFD
jgi:hypothetical protein